jgi:hypothetical protein
MVKNLRIKIGKDEKLIFFFCDSQLLQKVHQVPEGVSRNAHVASLGAYKAEYERSVNRSDEFWREKANELVDFFAPFTHVQSGQL